MTDAATAREAFSRFLCDHLGNYDSRAAMVIRAYLDTIGHDHEMLWATLRHQPPACDLIPPIADGGILLPIPTSDGEPAVLPDNGIGMHQVLPAYASYRIGHVIQRNTGWTGFHFLDPVGATLDRATQFEAVLSVFVAHFQWLGGPA